MNSETTGKKRAYASARRLETAAATRDAVMKAAVRLLKKGAAGVTMNAVAAAAGVTRLTVYNQFGSRRGLLEAVFDDHALKGGIKLLADAATAADPIAGIEQMIDVLCRFWGSSPAIAALQDASVADPELHGALESRQARRRLVIDALLARTGGTVRQRAETGDLLYGLISLAMFRSLAAGRKADEVARLMKGAAKSILDGEGATRATRDGQR